MINIRPTTHGFRRHPNGDHCEVCGRAEASYLHFEFYQDDEPMRDSIKTPPETPITKAKAAVGRLPLAYAQMATRITEMQELIVRDLLTLSTMHPTAAGLLAEGCEKLEKAVRELLVVP